MGVFFNDWSSPGQTYVEPRKTIRLSWYYYQGQDPDSDDPIQYFKVLWKPITIRGWTDPSIQSAIVGPEERGYNLPPYTWTLDSAWVWRVEAWIIDKDYDPDVPPGEGVPTGDTILGANTSLVVDTSGYTLWTEKDKVVSSGGSASVIINQPTYIWNMVPSDPGEYQVRFRVRNGFQWSAWSTPVSLMQYDTDKWVKKGSDWWAVPEWAKEAGTFVRVYR